MLDPSSVGRRSEPLLNEVEKGSVRRFATALGLADPVHHDQRAATAAGHRGLLAPHTFPVTFRSSIDLPAALALGSRTLLLAEQSLEIFRAVCSGDRISVVAVIAEVSERAGTAGPMDVVVLEDEGRDEQGHLVYRGRRTMIVRPPPRES